MALVKIREEKAGTGTTTSASAVAIVTFDVATGGPGGTALDDCTIFVVGRLAGFVPAGGTGVGTFDAAAFKVVSGTLTLIGSAQTVPPIKDTGGSPAGDLIAVGTVITYNAVGVAATTIEWYGNMDIFIYRPV